MHSKTRIKTDICIPQQIYLATAMDYERSLQTWAAYRLSTMNPLHANQPAVGLRYSDTHEIDLDG